MIVLIELNGNRATNAIIILSNSYDSSLFQGIWLVRNFVKSLTYNLKGAITTIQRIDVGSTGDLNCRLAGTSHLMINMVLTVVEFELSQRISYLFQFRTAADNYVTQCLADREIQRELANFININNSRKAYRHNNKVVHSPDMWGMVR